MPGGGVPLTVLFAAAALTLSGCTQTVRQEPFARFSSSVQELRAGADKAATLIGSWSREREVGELASLPPDQALDRIQGLQLSMGTTEEGSPDPSSWTSSQELLFLKIDRFRRAFYALNTSQSEYGAAMEALADPELVDPETFDKMRSDLNANLRAAGKALGVTEVVVREKPFKVDGFALFSTLTVEAARSMIEQQRQDRLIALIGEHQPQVEAVAEMGRQGVHILGLALWQEYTLKSQTLVKASLGQRPDGQRDPGATAQSRRSAIEQIIALDQRFTTELEALDSMERAYRALPAAHAALAKSIKQPATGLAAVRELYDAGSRLHAAYEELRKANEAAASD